jgi:hypothetical protein
LQDEDAALARAELSEKVAKTIFESPEIVSPSITLYPTLQLKIEYLKIEYAVA